MAVDAIEGPVMVIAGPGTGKTQILTLRIANIIKQTDNPPDSILALTFTESGVFSMRERLVKIIGSAGYKVHIHTFHGFCNEIITNYPDAFPESIGARNINDIDKINILKEIIEKSNLKLLKPFGDNFYYLNIVRGEISKLKRENILPADLEKIISLQEKEFKRLDLYHEKGAHKGKMKGEYIKLEKKIKKNKDLLTIYTAYRDELSTQGLYDYDDMIIETIRALESNPDLLLQVQEEYQYVLADEHQDANNSQNRLLELLVEYHDNPNLFIVGDEKQAIFRFQGASLENFRYFQKKFPSALLVTLVNNYRSQQTILDSAHSLIPGELTSQCGLTPGNIESRAFSKDDYEHLFLARDINRKIQEGVEPSEIAVLYRNNKDVDSIVRIFEKENIPFIVESDQNVLADTDIQKLIKMLKAIHYFGNDSTLVSILHIDFLGLDNLDVYTLLNESRKKPLYELLQVKFPELYNKLSSWKKLGENNNLLFFFETVLSESGFLNYLLSKNTDGLEKLNAFFDDIRILVENHKEYLLPDLISYLELLDEHNILIKKDSVSIKPNKVRLMTAHRSKGLEFNYVYIVGVYDKHWGNKRSIEHFSLPTSGSSKEDHLDDERRLFYVALTRAKNGVYLSYSCSGSNGALQLPSQFIEEISSTCVDVIDTASFEESVKPETFLTLSKSKDIGIKDKEYLNTLFLSQGLSVTALNNYLKSPWQYFYSNLLRIPKAPNKHLMFGTAIDMTLKEYFDTKEDVIKLFEKYLSYQPMTQFEYNEAYEKGVNALEGYVKEYAKSWQYENIFGKYRISSEFNGIPIRGELDKIEVLNGMQVNVVDYKTGKPKTRNDLEGKTKNSTGDYKRQLTFYKLLLELEEKFTMVSGEIDFVEPDQKGKYHKEKFIITDEDVSELKETIIRISKEIMDLSFWDTECDPDKCYHCDLVEEMRME